MSELFESFIRERRYLHNLAESTLTYYREVYHNFDKAGAFTDLSKKSLSEALIAFRTRGVTVGAINTYIRGINTFLRWLHENGHISENLSLKLLRAEKRLLRSLTDEELQTIIKFKPKSKSEKRLLTLLQLVMDSGIRINEALTLQRSRIDFDNLIFSIVGKGNKERVIPISYELRKILYKYLSTHKFELVFCNGHGGKLRYDNMRRDWKLLKTKLKLENTGGAFHPFRRTFATNYIRNKGNPFVLQRLLGHSTLAQTNEYVKLVTEDLQAEQHRTSLLNRLK